MRTWIVIFFIVTTVAAWADGCPVGVRWPGWYLCTTEEMIGKRYPITNMVDGDPATAWVYYKYWKDLPAGTTPSTGIDHRYGHGTDVHITLFTSTFDHTSTFVVDGIGLINGYAKSSSTYWRNNRITKIHVYASGEHDNWGGNFPLNETRAVQHINLPHQRYNNIDIRIDGVSTGMDDDLCISELVLYNHGKPVPWQLTRTVLANDMIECCGNPTASLYTHAGGKLTPADRAFRIIAGVAQQPGTSRMLLYAGDTLYLYDMQRSTVLRRRSLPGAMRMGWLTPQQAIIFTRRRCYSLRADTFTCVEPISRNETSIL